MTCKKSCEIQISMSIKNFNFIDILEIHFFLLLYKYLHTVLYFTFWPTKLKLFTIYYLLYRKFGDPWCKWLISNKKSPLCGEKCISKRGPKEWIFHSGISDKTNTFKSWYISTKEIKLISICRVTWLELMLSPHYCILSVKQDKLVSPLKITFTGSLS